MLTEERYSIILERVKQNKSVKLLELCELLKASESTIRRDLTVLDERGLLKKVHGGAISAEEHSFNPEEQDVESKSKLFTDEKLAIARFAASLVDDGDFIFIDAGTTTGYMIDFLPDKKITFVTNAFVHAKKLAQRGFKVYMPAGEIKLTTEAIVGAECVSKLQFHQKLSWSKRNFVVRWYNNTGQKRGKSEVYRGVKQSDCLYSCRSL